MANDKGNHLKGLSSLHSSVRSAAAKVILGRGNNMALQELSERALNSYKAKSLGRGRGWRIRAINAATYHIHRTHGRKTFKEIDIASPNCRKIFRKKVMIIILSLGNLPSMKSKLLSTIGIEAYRRENCHFH